MKLLGGLLAAAVLASCSIGGPTSTDPIGPSPSSIATQPVLTPVPPASTARPSPVKLEISGLRVTCGPLTEVDCRSVVSAFGMLGTGATEAEIGGAICDGRRCPSAPPSELVVGVVLRWGDGDLTKLLTCVRSTRGSPITCERAPVDLG